MPTRFKLQTWSVLVALCVISCGEGEESGSSEGKQEAPTKLVVEVDSVETAPPSQNSQGAVQAVLAGVFDELEAVDIIRDEALDARGTDHKWTAAELGTLAAQTSNLQVDARTIKLHALFVDGTYAGDPSGSHILGLTLGSEHLVVFKEKLKEICSTGIYASMTESDGKVLCDNSESAVWLHEIGHLLGLVNQGLPAVSDHEDKDHPGHTKSDESVMYWAYDWSSFNSGVVDLIYKRIMVGRMEPLDFGAACEADLAAAKEEM